MTEQEIDTDLLREVAGKIDQPYALMDSKWGNCESEVMAWQTLKAAVLNLDAHGDAFSWQGTGTRVRGSHANNPRGLSMLIDDGSIVAEPYEGDAVAPDGTVFEDGKPIVLRPTQALLEYMAGLVG